MDTATALVFTSVVFGFPLLASAQERPDVSLEKAFVSDLVIVPPGKADAAPWLLDNARSETERKAPDSVFEIKVNHEKPGISELNNRRKNLLIFLQILRGAK